MGDDLQHWLLVDFAEQMEYLANLCFVLSLIEVLADSIFNSTRIEIESYFELHSFAIDKVSVANAGHYLFS